MLGLFGVCRHKCVSVGYQKLCSQLWWSIRMEHPKRNVIATYIGERNTVLGLSSVEHLGNNKNEINTGGDKT